MRPVKTLRRLLVHPKDKQEREEITDCVYKIPCSNCEKTYIGETERKLGTRLKEHKTEVEATTKKPFTRSQRLHSLSEQNKSALTDHASRDNHWINWSQATILDRESDRGTRWIKEAEVYPHNSPKMGVNKKFQGKTTNEPLGIVVVYLKILTFEIFIPLYVKFCALSNRFELKLASLVDYAM